MKVYKENIREGESRVFDVEKTIYHGKTKFQSIDIIKNPSRGTMLFLDGKRQSDESDEFAYHEALVHPALQRINHPADILIIGGGEGATAREALKYKLENLYQMDIDREAVEIQRKYLVSYHQNTLSKVRFFIGDGLYFNTLLHNKILDAIIVDINEPSKVVGTNRLYSIDFYRRLFNFLKYDGIVALQISSAHPTETKTAIEIINKLKDVFKIVIPYFLTETQWVFAICSKHSIPIKKKNAMYIKDNKWYYQDIEPFKLPKYFLDKIHSK